MFQENYWQKEEESSSDWTPGLESRVLVSRMTSLVDIWQSVHLLMRSGYGTAGKVPDLSIRERLFEMREIYLQTKPRSKDCNSKNWKLKHALSYIEKQIFSLIKTESDAKELLNVMIQSQGFLIDKNALPLYLDNTPIEGDTIESLPRDLLKQWNELIGVLQSGQLIPELIEKLVEICNTKNEDSFRCNVAALWIVEVARSVLRLRSVQDVMTSYGVNLLEKSNLADYAASRLHAIKGTSSTSEIHVARLWEKASTQVDQLYPELTSVIVLPIRVLAPSKFVILSLLKKACVKPNKWTLAYMPRYMKAFMLTVMFFANSLGGYCFFKS